MKKYLHLSLILAFILALALSGCGGGNSGGPGGGTTYNPGQSVTCTISGVSFNIHYVPSVDRFPTGTGDSGEGSVNMAFWMAETEVTYQLWNKVKTWATGYTFVTGEPRHGRIGSADSGSEQQPVTWVSWREAVIWCNALTEYYYGSTKNCVYYSDADYATPIRSVNDSNIDSPYIKAAADGNTNMVNCIAKGFRLPISMEWELAARYKGNDNSDGAIEHPAVSGKYWTPGNYASSATNYAWNNTTNQPNSDEGPTQTVAVYNTTVTAQVKSKINGANALGLYDMSGNVWEWCFDKNSFPGSTARVWRGGAWDSSANEMQVSYVAYFNPDTADSGFGFRPVRTQ